MDNELSTQPHGMEDVEIQEWLESLDSVLESSGPEVAAEILERLRAHAAVSGIDLPFSANTPYANTIRARQSRGAQYRRAHFDVRFRGHTLRSGFQSFLPRAHG